MKKIDIYVGRTFLGTYLGCFLFFLGIFLVIDFFSKSNDFIKSAGVLGEKGYDVKAWILEYYLLSIPSIFLQIAPFITAMAAMFTMARFRHHNELIPMIFGGISLYRILLPVLVLATLSGGVMLLFQEVVVPSLWIQKTAYEYMLDKQKASYSLDRVKALTDDKGNVFFVARFDVNEKTAFDLSIRLADQGQPSLKKHFVTAEMAEFRDDGKFGRGWYLVDGKEEILFKNGSMEAPSIEFFGDTDIRPEDILVAGQDKMDISLSTLLRVAERHPERVSYRTLIHRHITYPLANIILVMLGIPWVLRFESRSLFFGVALALIICLAYFAGDLIGQQLGLQGIFDPAIAMWVPTLFFGSVGIVLFTDLPT